MTPDFKKNALIPCIVQDASTSVVLMLGYMNQEAFEKTNAEKVVTFFSRSKQRLWTKGETSGNFLDVKDILLDCDQDAILVKATPRGPVCHTGADTCFNEKNERWSLSTLESIIQDRMRNPRAGSYTNSLLGQGINKVAQKVGEEAVELIIEAKDNNKELFLGEAADLLFHLFVLLAAKGYSFDDVTRVLQQRHSK